MCQTLDTVFLDAVEYLHFTETTIDFDPPDIVGPGNLVVYDNVSSITIIWDVYDLTPWNYTIEIDSVSVEDGIWSEGIFEYHFSVTSLGNYSVTLTLMDIFGNQASDTVNIQVLEYDPGPTNGILLPLVISISGVCIAIVVFWQIRLRKE